MKGHWEGHGRVDQKVPDPVVLISLWHETDIGLCPVDKKFLCLEGR